MTVGDKSHQVQAYALARDGVGQILTWEDIEQLPTTLTSKIKIAHKADALLDKVWHIAMKRLESSLDLRCLKHSPEFYEDIKPEDMLSLCVDTKCLETQVAIVSRKLNGPSVD